MRSKMIVASLILHIALAVAALRVQANKKARRATAVAVVGKPKEKPPEKKKEEDKPKPKAAPPPQKLAMAAKTEAAPAPSKSAPVEAAAEAPVDSGLTLGNSDGPGIDVGGPVRKGPAPVKTQGDGEVKKASPVKRDKVAAEQRAAEEDTCTEAPSKPVPVTRTTEIEYTQDARAGGIEGRLVLKIFINADGSVDKVEVVSGVDPSLDAAAIAAVKTWTFKPAMRCGKPMGGVAFTLARRFELGD